MLPDGGKDMLNVVKGKSRAIEKAERKENSLYLYSEAGIHRIEPKNDAVIRVTYTQREEFSNTEKSGVLLRTVFPDWDYMETDTEIWLKMRRLTLVVNKKTASYSYFDSHGKKLLKERERESKNLEEFTVYRLEAQSSRIEKVHTPDGDKEVVMEAAKVKGGSAEPNRKKVGEITWEQVKAIAEDKLVDLNCFTVESAMKMVAGTARSMGITVKGEFPVNN